MKKHSTKEIFEKIVNYVQKIVENGEYENFLKFQKNFRGYSFNNLVLIYSQFPEATLVAGKSKWLKLKREVVEKPKKIWILAPIPRKYDKKIKEVNDNGDEIETVKKYEYIYYRYVFVYDISQTIGETIPLEWGKINTNEMNDFYEKLKKFSEIPVYERNLTGSTRGFYNPKREEIVLNQELSIDDKTAVLIHELTHRLYDDFDYKTDRHLSEVFVESIAYIVANHFGLDTSDCSFNYITRWSKAEPKIVIKLGTKIQRCADEFIKKIENFEYKEKVA